MAMVEKERKVESGESGRIDLMVQQLTGFPRAQVRGLFDHECVTVNGKLATQPGVSLREGDRLVLRYDPHTRYKEKTTARSRYFTLVHEDEHIIVVDKQAGVLTVPRDDEGQNTPTLVRELSNYLSRGRKVRKLVTVVHRLDRDTSGLLVFGKHGAAGRSLQAQFSAHTAGREYVAILDGHLQEEEGTFRSYLATAPDLDQYSTHQPERGKLAITHFRVEKKSKNATLVRVKLETGRRNQIRVHFAEAGHPVLGDKRYRSDLARSGDWPSNRLALHAARLTIDHPVTGETMEFTSAPPSVFRRFMAGTSRPPRKPQAAPAKGKSPKQKKIER